MKFKIVTVKNPPKSKDLIDRFPTGIMVDQVTFVQNLGNYEGIATWYKLWLKNHNVCSVDLFVPLNAKYKPVFNQWYKISVNNSGTILSMKPVNDSCCLLF